METSFLASYQAVPIDSNTCPYRECSKIGSTRKSILNNKMNRENQVVGEVEHDTIQNLSRLERPIFIRLGILLGRVMPRKTGLNIAAFVGKRLAQNKDNPQVRAVRANQWVIHDQSINRKTLKDLTEKVFQSSAKCIFDFFYFLNKPESLRKTVDFPPETALVFERIWNGQPCVLVCPHLSNFDLMGYALKLHNINVQVLSFPNPDETYVMQNQIRESLGIDITPMSLSAFRQARNNLRAGKSILTGLDRPLTGKLREKYKPTFFGYQTSLPVTYVRMAKDHDVPVFVVAAVTQPGNRYLLRVSQPIWMEAQEDLETETLSNVNRVLTHAEPLLKEYADQWAMFYPVWPQFLGI